ncbi:MAG TPA: TonB family protein [Bryobacteraceae bacterium]|nr:TonB family protein [Bryobacteraceae bacterium]
MRRGPEPKLLLALALSLPIGFTQVKTPNDSTEHFNNGRTLFDQRNFQGAAREFRDALTAHLEAPWDLWAHLYLGSIFEITNQHDRALKEFQLANDSSVGIYRASDLFPVPPPVKRVEPEYSEEARLAGLEGTATVSFAISDDGSPRDLRIEQSLGLGLDAKALEAVEHWRYPPNGLRHYPSRVSVALYFRLPNKQSRWHLLHAEFQAPEGTSRPVFSSAKYPLGAGISAQAADEGQLVGVMGRMATATIAFDIDEHGNPDHFEVQNASYDVWGMEAIALVRQWHFEPGRKGNLPVPVRAAFDLAWGARKLPINNNPPAPPSLFPNPAAAQPMALSEPSYTDEARQAHLEGFVLVSGTVGEDGAPHELRVLQPLGMGLDSKALEAVSKWRFLPGQINGRPASVPALFEVDFKLPVERPIRTAKQ